MKRLTISVVAWLTAVVLVGCDAPPACELCPLVAGRDVPGLQARLASGAKPGNDAWETLLEDIRRAPDRDLDRTQRQLAEIMLGAGADPNFEWRSPGGNLRGRSGSQSERHVAAVLLAKSDDMTLVDLLSSRGFDARGRAGGEALCAAVQAQRVAVVQRLLGAGAPVNHISANEGLTALQAAIQTRNVPLIGVLEAAGAVEWHVER